MNDFQEYLDNPKIAIVGRLLNYLNNPNMKTLPASCTILVPTFQDSGIRELIHFVSKALRCGAGVNVHLDNFIPALNYLEMGECAISLHPDHPEYTPDMLQATPWSFPVSDSMEEDCQVWPAHSDIARKANLSIEQAIYHAWSAGEGGYDLQFDLSALRPPNTPNSVGMVSSGALSFGEWIKSAYEFGKKSDIESLLYFLSNFNGVLLRGGHYKGGAITTSMPVWNKSALDYLTLPKEAHPWLKKGLTLSSDYFEYGLDELIIEKVNNGSLWLEKAVQQTTNGYDWLTSVDTGLDERLRSNVCREIQITSKATCDLSHGNLGQIAYFNELPDMLVKTTRMLCTLKSMGIQDTAGIYKKSSEDKQIGVGLIGLSNLLARFQITYREHVDSLNRVIKMVTKDKINDACYGFRILSKPEFETDSDSLAWWMIMAYVEASKVARSYGMERAFCIAPTANSSFRYTDLEGYSTSPEISPPISLEIERLSETLEDTDIFFYHPNAETAEQVGFHTYQGLVEAYQELFNVTGLGHSISFNIWEPIDFTFLDWFDNSEVLTTYYRITVDQGYLNKSTQFGDEIKCDCVG